MFVLLFFSRLFLKRIAKQPWDPIWAWRRNLSRGQCMRLGVFSPAALSSSFLLWRENNLARFNNAPTLCYSQVAHGIRRGRAALHPPFRAPQTAYHPRAGAFNADDINGTSPLLSKFPQHVWTASSLMGLLLGAFYSLVHSKTILWVLTTYVSGPVLDTGDK